MLLSIEYTILLRGKGDELTETLARRRRRAGILVSESDEMLRDILSADML